MKKIVLFSLLTVSVLSGQLFAQCNPYYQIKEGSSWEITNYNAKDKVDGRQVHEINEFEETSDGWKAVMSFKIYDKKDELTLEQDEVEFSCEDGVIHMDMQRFLPSEMMESLEGMNMELEVDNIELPSDLSVGATLDDGSVVVTGDLPMTMRVDITNRKVAAKETITTPAGTFECYKITYDVKTKMVMKSETSGAEWIAKDVGMVKSEVYKSNGKLMGYSLLTKVK